jgi:cation diffusion facilitator family transporter
MHTEDITSWIHPHQFHVDSRRNELKTWLVIGITLAMMIAEIAGGYLFNSMALLADGWHMGTHAAALGIAAFAYWYARRNAQNRRYTFGVGKVGVLGGYTSAVGLAIVAFLMTIESIERLLSPKIISFNEAIIVATIGLGVNVVCAIILQDNHHHHDHGHSHGHHHHDHNLRSAYFHVIADALTSVLAIIALLCGKIFGWIRLDAIMGIVGAAVILRWAYLLLRDTSKILLDETVGGETADMIRSILEADADTKVADLHLWRVGSSHISAIISLVTSRPQPPEYYKELLVPHIKLAHVTVEVHTCPDNAEPK